MVNNNNLNNNNNNKVLNKNVNITSLQQLKKEKGNYNSISKASPMKNDLRVQALNSSEIENEN